MLLSTDWCWDPRHSCCNSRIRISSLSYYVHMLLGVHGKMTAVACLLYLSNFISTLEFQFAIECSSLNEVVHLDSTSFLSILNEYCIVLLLR